MTNRERISFAKQISLCHAINNNNNSSFNIEIFNYKEYPEYKDMNIISYPYNFLSENMYKKIYIIRTNYHNINDLIYLSPDSENIMDKYDPNKIYIIGGIIDRTVSKNESKNRADLLHIKTMKLPLKDHITIGKPSIILLIIGLNIDVVFNILLNLKNGKDWDEAFKCIPLKNRFNGNVEMEKDSIHIIIL